MAAPFGPGGCIDAGCIIGDNTLIQAGTGQDVDTAGRATYYAWYELIPAPSITIPSFPVRPGDQMNVDIHETTTNANIWSITVQNLTTGQVWSTTLPYASTHLTAEWIEETPIVVDKGKATVGPLPNLSTVTFDGATVNGAGAGLRPGEAVQL